MAEEGSRRDTPVGLPVVEECEGDIELPAAHGDTGDSLGSHSAEKSQCLKPQVDTNEIDDGGWLCL